MKAFQQKLQKLEAADTQVLGVSMDSPFANKAFADQIGVTFPLLSDWGGDVTRQYGIYLDKYKAARRVNFLIGKDGKILEEQIDKDAIDPNEDRGCLRAEETEPLKQVCQQGEEAPEAGSGLGAKAVCKILAKLGTFRSPSFTLNEIPWRTLLR